MRKALFVILGLVLITACESSKKGAWSQADKDLANAEIAKIEGELDALGENKQAFIDCYLEKVEDNYSSFAEADADMAGCEALSMECATEVFSLPAVEE